MSRDWTTESSSRPFTSEKACNEYAKLWDIAILFAAVVGLSACVQGPTPAPPTPITVQLLWSHNAEFAGLYAADQKGFFAAEGLSITFSEGGPTVDYLSPVVNGKASSVSSALMN
ncbi:MAG: ABC transporter substrate-binding protein [Dehalococcoidia bacterium]|nr:ABC transporter substrate-binding protein [Dehalococcoidia bacterium]